MEEKVKQVLELCRELHKEHGLTVFTLLSMDAKIATAIIGRGEDLMQTLVTVAHDDSDIKDLLRTSLRVLDGIERPQDVN